MKIIISPAKTMVEDIENVSEYRLPVLLDKTKELLLWMKGLSYEELKTVWNCNDKLALLNYERIKNMDLYAENTLTMALLSYKGLQYQYMSSQTFDEKAWEYVDEHLRILSGFYGVVRAKDLVVPYRLEMQSAIFMNEYKELYSFWGDNIYKELLLDNEDRTIINLASLEYSKTVSKYLDKDDKFVTIDFLTCKDGKYKQKASIAKMARGEMVRYMALNNIKSIEEIKGFRLLGFEYSDDKSTAEKIVFVKQE